MSSDPPKVFISYSHADESWKYRLVKQLRVLALEDVLEVWDDRRIAAGDDWRPAIEDALEQARVAVFLVSADFLTSKFIREQEMPRILERRGSGLRVVPVIVDSCPWQRVPWLASIQGRPKDGQPLALMTRAKAAAALSAIAVEIADLLGTKKRPKSRLTDWLAPLTDRRVPLTDRRGRLTDRRAPPAPAVPAARRRPSWPAMTAAGIVLLGLGGWWVWRQADRAAPAVRPAIRQPAPRTALAVLPFRNLNGDAELDWLRNGIADLLRTDLAQSPDLEVLSGARLFEILGDAGIRDEPVASPETIRTVAEKGNVGTVVTGSYLRGGELVRITEELEDAGSGQRVSTHSADGRGEESLFAMVDELGGKIRSHFAVAAPAEAPETVAMVTTASVEAWRYYSQGMACFHESKIEEAVVLLEKAVVIDPGFALALADLGRVERNLGHISRAAELTRRALENAGRLPLNQRFFVEGSYFEGRWSTYGRAVEAYREGIRLWPSESIFREDLGRLYAGLERYDEADEVFKPLIRDGSLSVYAAYNAAFAEAANARDDSGYEILASLTHERPEEWLPRIYLGWYEMFRGRLAAAEDALRQAELRRPGDVFVAYSKWRLAVLREDWPEADLEARGMATKNDGYARWRGAVSLARDALYRGRSEEALERLTEAARAYPEPEASTAMARCWAAELLLDRGEPERALAEAQGAREAGRGFWPELQALFLEALAQEQLGRPDAADAAAATLRQRWQLYPNAVEERQLAHLAGRRALLRGDAAGAVQALRRAAALLPPRGVEIHAYVLPDHLPVWVALGEAELLAGDRQAALRWFQKAADSGVEHIEFPVPWVRSRFFLGQAHQELGESQAASQCFGRFLEQWRDADFDQHRLAEARRYR